MQERPGSVACLASRITSTIHIIQTTRFARVGVTRGSGAVMGTKAGSGSCDNIDDDDDAAAAPPGPGLSCTVTGEL